jgi:protein gp37
VNDTLIGWCHHTINFWRGCNKVNQTECIGCYAEAQAIKYGWKFEVLRPTRSPWLQAELLNESAKVRGIHELVFTCSISDFFHQQADPWREEAWDVIRRCKNLIWLVLTKRPERIPGRLPSDWNDGKNYPNVWLGVTCGEKASFNRVDQLRKINCALRFLSCEPLLEDISEINLEKVGWILCGGMSGDQSKSHAMDLRWAVSLYDTAQKAGVPFLFKQVSHHMTERGINALGLYLADRDSEPADPETVDCVREYPKVPGQRIIPPGIQGVRLNQPEWESYRRRHADNQRQATEAPSTEREVGTC